MPTTVESRTYLEKLRDPRWQRKRLEILQRDNWLCQLCGETKLTLTVHHRWYLKGHNPWDYPNEALVTLCEDCHEDQLEKINNLQQCWDHFQHLLWPDDIESIAVAIAFREHWGHNDPVIGFACWVLEHPDLLGQIATSLAPLMSNRMFHSLIYGDTDHSPERDT